MSMETCVSQLPIRRSPFAGLYKTIQERTREETITQEGQLSTICCFVLLMDRLNIAISVLL